MTEGGCPADRDHRTPETLVACGLAISLSVVLSHFRLFRMPYGGSVTLGSSVPVWIVARKYGVWEGLKAGFGAGTILMLLGTQKIHPVQVLLDYPFAWGALGLAGLTTSSVKGGLLSVAVRYALQVLSGVVFFASMAPKGSDPLVYSLLYNLYLIPDLAVAIVFMAWIEIRAPHLWKGVNRPGGREPVGEPPPSSRV